jgi:hypothetical protein
MNRPIDSIANICSTEIELNCRKEILHGEHAATISIPAAVLSDYHRTVPAEFIVKIKNNQTGEIVPTVCMDCWKVYSDKTRLFYLFTLGRYKDQVVRDINDCLSFVKTFQENMKGSTNPYYIFPWRLILKADRNEPQAIANMSDLVIEKGLADKLGARLLALSKDPLSLFDPKTGKYIIQQASNNKLIGSNIVTRTYKTPPTPTPDPTYNISSTLLKMVDGKVKIKTKECSILKDKLIKEIWG